MIYDIYETLERYRENIENEIKAEYPNSVCLNFNALFDGSIPSLVACNTILCALGFQPNVNFNKENRKAIDFLNSGALYFKVPEKSEIYFTDKNGEEIMLAGEAFAAIIKKIVIYLVDHFYIRIPHTEPIGATIKFKYKYHEIVITEELFNKTLIGVCDTLDTKMMNQLLDEKVANLSPESRHKLAGVIDELIVLFSYGIKIDGFQNEDGSIISDISEMRNMVSSASGVSISVPSQSSFTYLNKEIAGQNAIDFACISLKKMGISDKNVKFNFTIREDSWSREDYDYAIEQISGLKAVADNLR